MADELRVDSGALIFATLADVYISSGMIDEAISILLDGLARNPNYHLAKTILGRAYCINGDYTKAIETIEPIYPEVKGDETVNVVLGQCYMQAGDNEKARSFFEAALKINPDNTEVARALGKTSPDQHVPDEAPTVAAAPAPEPAAEEEAPAKEEPLPVEEAVQDAVSDGELIEQVMAEIPEKAVERETVPLETLDKPVKRLLDLDAVKNVVICTRDGLLIKHYGKGESDIDSICASAAAICLDVDESFRMLKRGGMTRCIIEKPDETFCVMAVGDSLLTVTTRIEAKPGLVFIYARKIIAEIEEILG